jgi:FlaA1/EpsC-like NDP-sugar epimerase
MDLSRKKMSKKNMIRSFIDAMYSGDNSLRPTQASYSPRWFIFGVDFLLVIFAMGLSKMVVRLINPDYFISGQHFYNEYALLSGLSILSFYLFKTYSGLVRHSTYIDLSKVFLATLCTSILGMVCNKLWLFDLRNGFLFIYFMISVVFLVSYRIGFKLSYYYLKSAHLKTNKLKVALYGVHDDAITQANGINLNANSKFEIAAFISTEKANVKKIMGKPVIQYQDFIQKPQWYAQYDGLVLRGNDLDRSFRNELVSELMAKNIKIYNLSSLKEMGSDAPEKNHIKSIEIDDLLERSPIKIEDSKVKEDLQGKAILVTGGAGSIGSEIVRQVAKYKPSLIVIADQAETPLHNLQLEMEQKFPEQKVVYHLANISNKYRMEQLFDRFDFSVIYHAAAYKHVPMIEENPQEAVNVNVMGVMVVSQLAVKHHVKRFVMVSTDKAVNPTNVMGASKRVAELYVQSLQNTPENKTRFITTRFGNVLGSNGSVIPHFKKQIAQGGPITVTHPEITRYFMTIPEACELVLQAGTMGQGGEIYVFDMGQPVKIIDLAIKMIKLSGLEPETDIAIKITGLRPGEKLYEELLGDKSKNLPTHHEKIMIAKDPTVPYEYMQAKTRQILRAVLQQNNVEVVKIIKEIVPEFISNNSQYETLDK